MIENTLPPLPLVFTSGVRDRGKERILSDVRELNIRIDNNHEGKVWFDDVKITKGNAAQTLIVEENNYYPFGLLHKGYNNVVSSHGNAVAQKFKYNGVEFEESLGLDLYEMDVRSYDPTIGRFTSIDPVTHHSMSTYTAFDNNPIYWADPSGANAVYNFDGPNKGKYTIGDKVVTYAEAMASYGLNTDGSESTEEDHVNNDSEKEMQSIADDLNRIFKKKFGKTPFSVKKTTRNKKVKDGFWPWSDDEYEKVTTYKLVGSVGFDWDQHYYTRMLKDILDAKSFIMVDIIPDKSNYDGGDG